MGTSYSEEFRLEALTEMYVASKITLDQLEDLSLQALKGEQPTINGLPIIADPDLISIRPMFETIMK